MSEPPRFTSPACEGLTDLFYPPVELGSSHPWRAHAEATAKAVCAGCPQLAPCRRWAINTNERYGLWGGTTPAERADLRWQQAARRQAVETMFAEARGEPAPPAPKPAGEPKPHGTDARYRKHLRDGDTICDACNEAHRRAAAETRAAVRSNPERAERRRQAQRAYKARRRAALAVTPLVQTEDRRLTATGDAQ